MARAQQKGSQSTVTTRDPPARDKAAQLCEEPFRLSNDGSRAAATSPEDTVTKELSEHQDKPQDTESPTVKERKKKDKTPPESPQSKEKVPKSSPRGQGGTDSTPSSSQGNAEAESESSKGFWKKLFDFFTKSVQLVIIVAQLVNIGKDLIEYLMKFFSQFK